MTESSLRTSAVSVSGLAYAVTLAFLVVLSVWVVIQPYPALQDFVEWMYQGYVLNRLMVGDPLAVASHFVTRYPVPNSMLQYLLALLNFTVDPVTAGKLVILLYIWSFFGVMFAITRHVTPRYAGTMLLVAVMIFIEAPTFWNGNLNFNLSLLLLSVYLYQGILKDRETPLLVAVIGILIFFTHAVGLSVFVMLVGARNLLLRRRWSHLFALAPALALLAFYILAKPPDVPVSYTGYYDNPVYMVMYKAYTVMKAAVFRNFILGDGSSYLEAWPALYWAGVVLNGLFGALVVIGTILAAWRSLQWDRAWQWGLGLLVAGVIAVLFLALPPFILGVANLGERYLLAGLLVAMVLLPFDRRILAGLAALAVVAMPYFVGLFVLTARADVRDYPRSPANAPTLAEQVAANLPNTRLHLFAQRLYFFAWRGVYLTQGDYSHLPEIHFGTGPLQARSWPSSGGGGRPE